VTRLPASESVEQGIGEHPMLDKLPSSAVRTVTEHYSVCGGSNLQSVDTSCVLTRLTNPITNANPAHSHTQPRDII
jgi:hypothetical protein